jgi:hypothetical protein
VNPLGRGTRRADEWTSPHERARARAAQRLDWELDDDETAWLEAHLDECSRCQAAADEYSEIRDRLRTMRLATPEPPRDLWARTAAAIEREAERSHGRRSASPRRFPVGALSGVLVIAVVMGATLLSNLPLTDPVTPVDEGSFALASTVPSTVGPGATPIAVVAGDVQYVRRDPNGRYDFNVTPVDEVCADDSDAGCPLAEEARATALTFEADPKSIIGSPDDNQAIIVTGTDGSTATDVYVMSLPTDQQPATPAPSVLAATASPPGSDPPTESEPPIDTSASTEPTESDVASTAVPSDDPTTAPPSDDPSAEPTIASSAEPEVSPAVEATPMPEPSAIARDLIVAGDTAAYSPDGTWFAFTARPSDESHGSDIYLWRVGGDAAQPVTTDHRSVFASWIDGRLVGSRPEVALDDGDEADAESFLLDPETGVMTPLAGAGWRPVVAPTGAYAVTWNGTVIGRDGGRQIGFGSGRLELAAWDGLNGPVEPADATLIGPDDPAPFDARWDETSDALAVWVRDPANAQLGRLSLYFIDPRTGQLDQPKNAPRDVPALAGFSIGEGRLAWATPPGQGGEGSRVLIVAWTDDGVGRIESAPGDQLLVIR